MDTPNRACALATFTVFYFAINDVWMSSRRLSLSADGWALVSVPKLAWFLLLLILTSVAQTSLLLTSHREVVMGTLLGGVSGLITAVFAMAVILPAFHSPSMMRVKRWLRVPLDRFV